MPSPTIVRQIETRLLERDVRYTKGRQQVIKALSDADGPLSAAEIHRGLSAELPLSSLYRSLSVLEDAGVISPHHGTRGITRYEMAEWLSGHHHHLVCDSCGSVGDIEIRPSVERNLESLAADVAAEKAFVPSGHALEIYGTCSKCR